jgi:hypothetical protein
MMKTIQLIDIIYINKKNVLLSKIKINEKIE